MERISATPYARGLTVCAQVKQDGNFFTDILIPILVVVGFLAGVVYAVGKLIREMF